MALGRNLGDVLDKLKALMPAQYHEDIGWFANAIRYRAPEREHDSWAEVQAWLMQKLQVPRKPPLKITKGDEWKVSVLALWADKSEAQMCADGLFEFDDEVAS